VTSRRIRITIAAPPLTVQPTAEDAAGYQPPRRGEHATPLVRSGPDRADGRRRYEVNVAGWRFEATVEDAARAELRDRAQRAAAEHQVASEAILRAQIPGRVARLWVAVGEVVEEGQRLLAVEAMKMETEIRAPRAGTVHAISVEVGAKVERDEELLRIG
jgi:oxaloacetate decarboxylase alpha subunit